MDYEVVSHTDQHGNRSYSLWAGTAITGESGSRLAEARFVAVFKRSAPDSNQIHAALRKAEAFRESSR